MPELPEDLIGRLLTGPVRRHRIADELGVKKGVSAALKRHVGQMETPHVIERHRKGRRYEVDYRLRPADAGEEPGRIIEMKNS